MAKRTDNKSALSGLMMGARKAKDEKLEAETAVAAKSIERELPPPAAKQTATAGRERFSIYADKATFERVRNWAAFLNKNQADIIERALSLYCDRLGEEYNDGKDPNFPQREAPTKLP